MYQKVIEIETTKYKNFLDLFTSVSISSFQQVSIEIMFYAFVQGFHGPCSYQSHFNHIAVMWEKEIPGYQLKFVMISKVMQELCSEGCKEHLP